MKFREYIPSLVLFAGLTLLAAGSLLDWSHRSDPKSNPRLDRIYREAKAEMHRQENEMSRNRISTGVWSLADKLADKSGSTNVANFTYDKLDEAESLGCELWSDYGAPEWEIRELEEKKAPEYFDKNKWKLDLIDGSNFYGPWIAGFGAFLLAGQRMMRRNGSGEN